MEWNGRHHHSPTYINPKTKHKTQPQFKYTPLLVSALLPLLCYYLAERFWRDSAHWRRTYMAEWPETRARARRGCTALGMAVALTSAALVSFGHLPAIDAFAVTWTASLALFLAFVGYAAVGNLARKLFVILETEAERVDFFLQVHKSKSARDMQTCMAPMCSVTSHDKPHTHANTPTVRSATGRGISSSSRSTSPTSPSWPSFSRCVTQDRRPKD